MGSAWTSGPTLRATALRASGRFPVPPLQLRDFPKPQTHFLPRYICGVHFALGTVHNGAACPVVGWTSAIGRRKSCVRSECPACAGNISRGAWPQAPGDIEVQQVPRAFGAPYTQLKLCYGG